MARKLTMRMAFETFGDDVLGLARTCPELFCRVEQRGRAVNDEPEPPVEPPAAPAASLPDARPAS